MSEQNVSTSGFDLSQVLAMANKASSQSEGGSGSREKLIYPQIGTIKVKLLFDPKSQVVIRKFERHTVGDNKVACLQQYGVDCPICKILGDIENAKGIDLWKMKRTSRGICYAEYVSDTYKWDNPNDKPQPGEVVMIMFPWTVYQDLNRIMSSAGPNLAQIVASNIGAVVNIERYVQNNQTKYSASLDAFDMNHQTRPTDQEYNELLMGLDDLNDKFVPITIDDSIQSKAREVAEQLSREYLNPVPNYQQGSAGMNLGSISGSQPQIPTPNYYKDPSTGIEYDLINNQWVQRQVAPPTPPVPTPPVPTPPVPTPPAQQPQLNQQPNLGGIQSNPVNNQQFMSPPSETPTSEGNPSCFGKHGDPSMNANQCLVCFKEAECASCSKN